MVIPLVRAATLSWAIFENPQSFELIDTATECRLITVLLSNC